MPRRAGSPKERKHVHLTEGAWDRLTELYKSQGISPSSVISRLVDFHIKRVEEKANRSAKSEIEPADVELSDVGT